LAKATSDSSGTVGRVASEELVGPLPVEENLHPFRSRELHHVVLGDDAGGTERLVLCSHHLAERPQELLCVGRCHTELHASGRCGLLRIGSFVDSLA
jgi:hypothetical protein